MWRHSIRGIVLLVTCVLLVGCVVERCEWTPDDASGDDFAGTPVDGGAD